MAGKTLVNSACNMIINSTPDLAYAANENENGEEYNDKQIPDHSVTDFQEAEIVEDAPSTVDPATGEVRENNDVQEQEENEF